MTTFDNVLTTLRWYDKLIKQIDKYVQAFSLAGFLWVWY